MTSEGLGFSQVSELRKQILCIVELRQQFSLAEAVCRHFAMVGVFKKRGGGGMQPTTIIKKNFCLVFILAEHFSA